MRKINSIKAASLFNSADEVSILDTTFARKVGYVIDESRRQECIEIGENLYMTVRRTKIKSTLSGSLVDYLMHGWENSLDEMPFLEGFHGTGRSFSRPCTQNALFAG